MKQWRVPFHRHMGKRHAYKMINEMDEWLEDLKDNPDAKPPWENGE